MGWVGEGRTTIVVRHPEYGLLDVFKFGEPGEIEVEVFHCAFRSARCALLITRVKG